MNDGAQETQRVASTGQQSMLEAAWHTVTGLVADHWVLLSWMGGLSLLMFVGSLIAVPTIIVLLPEDFLRRNHKLALDWPLYLSAPFLILKNCLGAVFLLSGLVMLVLPGHGLVTLLIGLAMVDFPRKNILTRRLLGHKRLFSAINSLRARLGRPELEPPW